MKKAEYVEEAASQSDPTEEAQTLGSHVDALDVTLLLARSRRFILLATLLFLMIGVVIALVLRPTYTAEALILPPQQQQSSLSAMMGQLGSLASLGGGSSIGASALGLKSSADMYIGFLKSRTIGDDIIDRFKLRQVYKKKTMYELRKKLQAASDIESGKDGLIHIAVKDHDPNRASEIANAYVDELYKMNSNVAITEAAQRRAFFNQQLTEEKNALASAEDDFRNTELKTGVIQLGGQAVEVIRRIAEMRAEIASREVQLQSLRTYATDQNPDVTRLQQEIGAMRAQLSKLESSQQEEPGNTSVPAGQVPEASLEYARKLRELKYHESLYELLAKQLEAARIDEAKSAPIIQVIDRAVPPDHKSGPPRLLLILGITCVGLASAIAWVLLSQSFLRLRHTGDSKHKLDELSSMFKERIV